MFVDLIELRAQAGNGGNGLVSFRREKFVDKGGPDGGNGGSGGDVIIQASSNEYDLTSYRFVKRVVAESGQAGGPKCKRGKNGRDKHLLMPVGTLVKDMQSGKVLADLLEDKQQVVVASGGQGGFGNAHFKSSTNRVPLVAEKGLKGKERLIRCELKLLAEVGLIGLPNAGKSTFLRSVSRARPKVGAYPFTTLEPHLGVAFNRCLLADIPGLIAGAAQGKGLGHQFLRHVERTLVLLHLIDCQSRTIADDYLQIVQELEAYNPALAKIPQCLALSKIDMIKDRDKLNARLKQLQKVAPKGCQIYCVSAMAGLNLKELMKDLRNLVNRQRQVLAKSQEKAEPETKVFRLKSDPQDFEVSKQDQMFVVTGQRIETLALKTEFANFPCQRQTFRYYGKEGNYQRATKKGMQPRANSLWETSNRRVIFGFRINKPRFKVKRQ